MTKEKSQVAVGEEISIDFSTVKPFEPLDPDVVYGFAVSKVTPGKSKNNLPKVTVDVVITSPEEVQVVDLQDGVSVRKVDDNGEAVMTKASGRHLIREYSLEQKALPFLYEFVKAVRPDAVLDENFKFKPDEYVGLAGACKIENEAYEEQVRARLKKVLPATAL